ncbi:Uncharacterized membrane protein [Paenibacillus sophorae]|uniref:DUF1003 domain-containing protein n=1 Tax=Paenibacillus sophorae TaxID=1333845 RepID=A0A1H8Q8D8_9BACL|nr:DUF1003 domain-containing protein [Paenibacillus sophorae]QWU15235.1 DUF1003 domain-containing protein [Paenibacillus sophorae]SEO50231.1 Uncharacterized membrane protein [Paenibacillus sophorae]
MAQENAKTVPPEDVTINGFGIELNDKHKGRIDNYVELYEKRIVAHLDEEYSKKTGIGGKLADRIAAFGGSWKFIIYFTSFLALWIIWNVLSFTRHFDTPPFILLNLCLSFLSAFQAPVIMMSQNRQAARDKHEAIIDFAINYKAEQEIDDVQGHLHRIENELQELKALLMNQQEKSIKSE